MSYLLTSKQRIGLKCTASRLGRRSTVAYPDDEILLRVTQNGNGQVIVGARWTRRLRSKR